MRPPYAANIWMVLAVGVLVTSTILATTTDFDGLTLMVVFSVLNLFLVIPWPRRFSLRTLLIATAIVAAVLGLVVAFR